MNININSLTEEMFCRGRKSNSREEGAQEKQESGFPADLSSITVWTSGTYVLHMQNAIRSKAKKREKKQCLKIENKLKQMNLTIYQVSGQTTQSKHSRTQSLNSIYFVEYSLSTNSWKETLIFIHYLIVRNDPGVVTFEHVHKTKMQFWEGCWQLGFSMKKKNTENQKNKNNLNLISSV